jgi:predicted nucleotidyltransferase
MVNPDANLLLQQLRQIKPQLEAQYPSICYLGLFGSFVRNEQHPASDVDILIDFDLSRGLISLFDYCQIEYLLNQALGRSVDLVDKSGLKRKIGRQILSEVIAV